MCFLNNLKKSRYPVLALDSSIGLAISFPNITAEPRSIFFASDPPPTVREAIVSVSPPLCTVEFSVRFENDSELFQPGITRYFSKRFPFGFFKLHITLLFLQFFTYHNTFAKYFAHRYWKTRIQPYYVYRA